MKIKLGNNMILLYLKKARVDIDGTTKQLMSLAGLPRQDCNIRL
jgi:hypothetical protein